MSYLSDCPHLPFKFVWRTVSNFKLLNIIWPSMIFFFELRKSCIQCLNISVFFPLILILNVEAHLFNFFHLPGYVWYILSNWFHIANKLSTPSVDMFVSKKEKAEMPPENYLYLDWSERRTSLLFKLQTGFSSDAEEWRVIRKLKKKDNLVRFKIMRIFSPMNESK